MNKVNPNRKCVVAASICIRGFPEEEDDDEEQEEEDDDDEEEDDRGYSE